MCDPLLMCVVCPQFDPTSTRPCSALCLWTEAEAASNRTCANAAVTPLPPAAGPSHRQLANALQRRAKRCPRNNNMPTLGPNAAHRMQFHYVPALGRSHLNLESHVLRSRIGTFLQSCLLIRWYSAK